MKIVALRDVATGCIGGTIRMSGATQEERIIDVYASTGSRYGQKIVLVVKGRRERVFDFFTLCIRCNDGTYIGDDDAFHLVPRKD